MPFKLSLKLLLVNLSIISALVAVFLYFSSISNRTLLSKSMNGIDEEAMAVLAVKLAQQFQEHNSWQFYIDNNNQWASSVTATFFQVFFSLSGPPPEITEPTVGLELKKNKICDPPFGTFLQRLSLLDEHKNELIMAEIYKADSNYQAIKLHGKVIGWLRVGKIDMDVLPLAEHFFREQVRLATMTAVIGGVLAVLLNSILSHHITSPIKKLTLSAGQIAKRNFKVKVEVKTRDELADLANSLNSIVDEFQRYETMQKQWLLDVSHELRTPLTILFGEIAAINDDVTPCNKTSIASLSQEIVKIKGLVDDLYELSKMEEIGFNLKKEPVDIGVLVTESLDRYQDRLKQRGLNVHWQSPGKVILIDGDPMRISQLMANLLENCLRYTSDAGEIWLAVQVSNQMVNVIIDDSGPGVPEQSLTRLFDRLYRAETSRSRVTGGTGLGLTICQKIVEAHGGVIRAANSAKGGLRLEFNLPLLK